MTAILQRKQIMTTKITMLTITERKKNTMLAIAMLAGLLSLPAPWMTIHNATAMGMNVDITGFSGYFTWPIKFPFWVAVTIAIVASGLQLMRNSKIFYIPRAAEWTAVLIALD